MSSTLGISRVTSSAVRDGASCGGYVGWAGEHLRRLLTGAAWAVLGVS
jgi:hypothetical protein